MEGQLITGLGCVQGQGAPWLYIEKVLKAVMEVEAGQVGGSCSTQNQGFSALPLGQ